MTRSRFLLVPLFLLALVGCDGTGTDTVIVTTGVVVGNQGNFTDGNGSVMVIDPESGTVSTLASGFGSVVQSVTVVGDSVYVTANSAGRIDVIDLDTGTLAGQVTGLTSPRYIAMPNATTAYVTNLFESGFTGGTVDVIDLPSQTVVNSISVGDNPEGLAVAGGRLFVANHGFGAGRTLSVISTVTQEVTATVDVECDGPRMLFADSEADLWVLCTGQTIYDDEFNVIAQTPGQIVILNPGNGAELGRITLEGQISTAGPGQDAHYSEEEQELHVVLDQNRVMRINTGANVVVDTFGPIDGDPIGAVAYDAAEERLYLGRIPGFATNGTVTVHDRNAIEVDSYPVGVAPSHFDFVRAER